MKSSFPQIDWKILFTVTSLLIFSISAVLSASASFADMRFGSYDFFLKNHIRNVTIAYLLMIIASRINYRFWKKIIKPLLWICFVLLISVFIFGSTAKGANRWIQFGSVNFQPSELVKLVLIIYIAKILDERNSFLKDFKFTALPIFFWTTIFLILIALQPNFSTSFVILLAVISILLVSNLLKKFVLQYFTASLMIGMLFSISANYRISRIGAFFQTLNTDEKNTVSYQINQALIAFGNGGLLGLGPGHSRQSQLFLPESYGDFIFSIIGEEYGFVGTSLITFLFAYLLARIYKLSKFCSDFFSFYIVVGTFFILGYFFLVNTAVNLGLLPTTGLPMPFVSYGGTALLVYGLLIGIVLNISKEIR
ncbi:MAG: FtsW/RodA/SpoVE family cell cycle protein [Candidatus Kapaibacteriales bacterium]